MKIPRSITYRIRQLLDEWVPPAIRDRRIFTWLPARLLFGPEVDLFLDFKRRALNLSDEEFAEVYRRAHQFVIERETDLTKSSLAAVLDAVVGQTVLEVGCGNGYLSNQLSTRAPGRRMVGCDIFVGDNVVARYPNVEFVQASANKLPFEDRSFDCVVSTHVLEHVQNIGLAVSELRRVAKKRLVIVVPRQRPYRYTFDLHLHFFPYEYTLIAALNPAGPHTLRDLDGDWVYVEEIAEPA
ncbi:MAG: class I SAM-dependent methyltransferase [Polyangiales bacterium]